MKPKVGLLPLYLKLYDDTMPELRATFGGMLNGIAARLTKQGISVCRADVCRLKPEFAAAVEHFEKEDVDLIITVHLAYSPSLESADILARTSLPILMLDTTLDVRFPQAVDPMRLMYNHGIHGVQDLASVLRRMGKPYRIAAGHCEEERVFERAAEHARGALAAKCLRATKALRIGKTFEGMGDFAIDDAVLRERLGISVDEIMTEPLKEFAALVEDDEIQREFEADLAAYEVTAPPDVHRRSVRVGLALRRLLEQGAYSAFSMNFLAFDSPDAPLDTVPFLEASKAMARGTGYAGEGDVLTASLVGALERAFGQTTFTEMFCPDWKGQSIFISHMGEVNPLVASGKARLCEKDFPWTPALNPAILTCSPKPGAAALVNIAAGPNNTFGLVIGEVTVEPDDAQTRFRDWVRGWIRPAAGIEAFLEEYSRAGGTHHCALVLGSVLPELRAFAAYAGLECTIVS
jgi:L-arabinose isomerase